MVLACFVGAALPVAAKEKLALERVSLPLPGAPAQVISTDMTGDGLPELVIAVAYTEWDQVKFSELEESDEVMGLVEVLTIVPSLFDRRELWIFEPTAEGEYQAVASPTELSTAVLSIEAGPSPEMPLLALTDEGVSVVRLVPETTAESGSTRALDWQEIYSQRHVAAGSETFLSGLELLHDLDGDGLRDDLLFPAREGLDVLIDLGALNDLDSNQPSAQLIYPPEDEDDPEPLRRNYPLPKVGDLDGDGLADLLLQYPDWEKERFFAFYNRSAGSFSPPVRPFSSWPDDDESEDDSEDEDSGDDHDSVYDSIVHFGDLDGDGRAEAITDEELGDEDAGFRKEMRQAKNPPIRYRLFRTTDARTVAAEPYRTFEATGYAFGGDSEIQLPGGVQDLNGDGRADLVTMTLDFSMLQAVRVLATHSIKIGIDFHVFCQTEDGRFPKVQGMDLSGKFHFDFDELKLGQLSQFAGDFDGDGRSDFVQIGRGKTVGIHRANESCFYPERPDLVVKLIEEPLDLGLFQVRDLDDDGLADLMVTQPQNNDDPGETAPVRLDLYLSRFAP